MFDKNILDKKSGFIPRFIIYNMIIIKNVKHFVFFILNAEKYRKTNQKHLRFKCNM